MRNATVTLALTMMAVAIGVMAAGSRSPQQAKTDSGTNADRPADREAIAKSSREFAQSFEKGDAKQVASFWTDNGEYQGETGDVIHGRAAIEKAYSEHFKEQPRSKMEVRIQSIRFLSRDSAIEEGILRVTRDDNQWPATSEYSTVHVREDGQWKIAYSREWGAGQHRLDDLEWLLGTWKGRVGDQEIDMTFEMSATAPCINGRFTKKAGGKNVASGTMRIAIDPQRGQLRSWHFDDDGGHGQALWLRDGNRWVMDSIGALTDGAETVAVNVIHRISRNEIGWRSIDRTVGGQPLPDTLPVKLVRSAEGK